MSSRITHSFVSSANPSCSWWMDSSSTTIRWPHRHGSSSSGTYTKGICLLCARPGDEQQELVAEAHLRWRRVLQRGEDEELRVPASTARRWWPSDGWKRSASRTTAATREAPGGWCTSTRSPPQKRREVIHALVKLLQPWPDAVWPVAEPRWGKLGRPPPSTGVPPCKPPVCGSVPCRSLPLDFYRDSTAPLSAMHNKDKSCSYEHEKKMRGVLLVSLTAAHRYSVVASRCSYIGPWHVDNGYGENVFMMLLIDHWFSAQYIGSSSIFLFCSSKSDIITTCSLLNFEVSSQVVTCVNKAWIDVNTLFECTVNW
jgi:hypothetical protein